MKLAVVLVVALVVGSAMAATAAQTAGIVEMRVDKIMAKQPISGAATFTWDGQSAVERFAVKVGERIYLSHVFANVPLSANQSIVLTDEENRTLLAMTSTFDGASLRLVDSHVDESRLILSPDDSSVRVVVGSVTGDFNAKIALRGSVAGAVATLAVDTNGNGTIESEEIVRLTGSGPVVNGTITVVNVPPTTPWALSIQSNGTTILAYHGLYDWAEGSFVVVQKDRLDPTAVSILQSVEIAPARQSVSGIHSIPNSLLLKSVTASQEPGTLPKLGLVLTFGDAEVAPMDHTADVSAREHGEDLSIGQIPLLIVLGAVVILAIGMILLAIRKKRERTPSVAEMYDYSND